MGHLVALVAALSGPLALEGEVTDMQVAGLQAQIEAVGEPVTINIDTTGGSHDAARKFAKFLDGKEITCVVDGDAMSAGFYILQSCKHRYATSRSVLMIHEVGASIAGTVRVSDIDRLRNDLDTATKALANQCARRMKISSKELLSRIAGKEWYMTAEEALAVGAIDKIVEP